LCLLLWRERHSCQVTLHLRGELSGSLSVKQHIQKGSLRCSHINALLLLFSTWAKSGSLFGTCTALLSTLDCCLLPVKSSFFAAASAQVCARGSAPHDVAAAAPLPWQLPHPRSGRGAAVPCCIHHTNCSSSMVPHSTGESVRQAQKA
jgi:hypothetical protein